MRTTVPVAGANATAPHLQMYKSRYLIQLYFTHLRGLYNNLHSQNGPRDLDDLLLRECLLSIMALMQLTLACSKVLLAIFLFPIYCMFYLLYIQSSRRVSGRGIRFRRTTHLQAVIQSTILQLNDHYQQLTIFLPFFEACRLRRQNVLRYRPPRSRWIAFTSLLVFIAFLVTIEQVGALLAFGFSLIDFLEEALCRRNWGKIGHVFILIIRLLLFPFIWGSQMGFLALPLIIYYLNTAKDGRIVVPSVWLGKQSICMISTQFIWTLSAYYSFHQRLIFHVRHRGFTGSLSISVALMDILLRSVCLFPAIAVSVVFFAFHACSITI